MRTVTRSYAASAASCLCLLCLFGAVAWAGQTRSRDTAGFSSSTDVEALISRLKFKLDPKRHSIVILGFRWKGKTSGREYPLTAVVGGTIDQETTRAHVWHVYRRNVLDDLGLHLLAQSENLALYLIFESVDHGEKSEGVFRFVGFESEGSRVETVVRPTSGQKGLLVETVPVKVGAIHYAGSFVFDVEADSTEAAARSPERSKEVFLWITKNFPIIPGFRFENQ